METNTLKHFFLIAFLIFSQYISAQLPEQDCSGAIQEFAVIDSFPPYVGQGQFQELIYQVNTSCLNPGEENSVWIRFSACENDTLEFLITPLFPYDDFDWALYDMTNKTCADALDSLMNYAVIIRQFLVKQGLTQAM